MKIKISDKQYAMIEKITRTKVGLNPQWWTNSNIEVTDIDSSCERYEECVLTNLNGLIREAMVAKYLDNVGISYDWWIPFASGNLVDRVSEFHISKHKIDVKPVIDIKFIENGEPLSDGKINVETLMQGLALDATQSYFRNKIDDIYIGVYLTDRLNGDIKGYQWRDSNKWRRYLRGYNFPNETKFDEPKYNTAMCCPVNDLMTMNSFKDIDDIMFNKSPTSHRFIDANRNSTIPNSYTWLNETSEYDMTFIDAWCKEWKLVWDDGIFIRGGKNSGIGSDIGSNIGSNHNTGRVGSTVLKKVSKDNRRRRSIEEDENTAKKLSEDYENVKKKLKEEERKRKLNDEYEVVKKGIRKEFENIKIINKERMEYGNMGKAKNVDVLGITDIIVARSEKWKELTGKIKELSDKKVDSIKRRESLELELRDINNEIGELSTKIDDYKKESEQIEDSFRLIDQIERKVEEKN